MPEIEGQSFLFFILKNESKKSQGRGKRKMQKVKWLDKDCNKCGRQLNSWDARLSKTLAYKYPCCESCIAEEYGMSAEALKKRMEDYFGMRPCQGL